ncbi:alpha-ketoacid dehydrogenase subunit beta [archaeon]
MRNIRYADAINEAHRQMLEEYTDSLLIGQGLDSPWSVGTSTLGLTEKFEDRVIDTPIAENGITGVAVGAALAGIRAVVVHPRMDFMYLAMDQILNHAANWYYMFGGMVNCPVTVRGIINRGNEQAAQHSQSLQSMFMHVPGLKVVMPSTPYDAKGLLIACVRDPNPTLYIDDRWLYSHEADVPEEPYEVPIGKGVVRREGSDVSIVSMSFMATEAEKAAAELAKNGVSAEVIDLRSLKPMDKEIILKSVKKTGRLVVADGVWKTGGVGAEVAAVVAESDVVKSLEAPIQRVSLPDTPTPSSTPLENEFFKTSEDIIKAVNKVM